MRVENISQTNLILTEIYFEKVRKHERRRVDHCRPGGGPPAPGGTDRPPGRRHVGRERSRKQDVRRPLPETEGEYWPALWEEREREFDFFADNPELGQIMMLSLGECGIGDGTGRMLHGSLLHLFRRKEALIRRGQELGLVRSDIGVGSLMNVMRSIGKALCVSIFGADVRSFMALPAAERVERSHRYLALMQDLALRVLSAGEVGAGGVVERWRAVEEGAVLLLRSGSMSFTR